MKTIGIDLWGTLIKANPKFKERKQDLFEKNYYNELTQHIKHILKDLLGYEENK